ncbi:CRISPR-associated protein Csm1 [Methylomagnum ishizawai]|uniref:CRISPR system single-strand-specific deoxyribonuclease Cas10/Csm1 (subtype III-A) n=1 Tax=Methylomagnum ishizawai TaxID=1760988 RepID=A0A1Y6D2U3_9GAMM|nr:type III-A CRISPR-associated protein Cas10/Csm1 [Methylomagnum ishizawai]SMF96977.1 CRISPR-associated protein Csm1 [Methylomagnum ishizawai]
MTDHPRLAAACRVALAAYLHDLGKFAERARIPEALDSADGQNNTRADLEKQNYCPFFNGRHTHVHAAYTAIGFDLLEKHLPRLVGGDMAPFAPWRTRDADDSLINAAARHHKPETHLQWIVATADRLASGFEREEFAAYNQAADEEPGRKLDHYTTRQWTLLESICLDRPEDRAETPAWRYQLRPLSPAAIFPMRAEQCENVGKTAAQAEYLALWDGFREGLERIPEPHRANLPLWLDHFDSLWLAYTHAIPAATAGIGGKVRPEVSLYDHSKTTAALAVALWRYHADREDDPAQVRERLRAQWDRERESLDLSRQAWEEEKFLLVQGDLFGIQDFIFATGGETQKRAAKLLRGRSFYVSLLTELAALRILEALGLPATSQVVNAAGKFLIVAPNTPETLATLDAVRAEFDRWFLRHSFGQSGIGIACVPARCDDFRAGGKDEPSPFRGLMERLFRALETAKLRRFGLCGEAPAPAVFDDFLERFKEGECKIDGRSPAEVKEGGVWMNRLAADQIDIGHWLANRNRLLVTSERVQPLYEGQNLNQLRLDIFGFHVLFTATEDETGKFGQEAKTYNLRRAWDFSLPESGGAALWHGYARRHINAYIPRFRATDLDEAALGKYDGLDPEDRDNESLDLPKTLNHLARDDRQPDEKNPGRWVGAEALTTLKGDVDNLGRIFQKGMERPSFAKMAALSRQMNAFFAVYLPWLCATDYPDTYTVFAGGDDFFLVGPWHSTLGLAQTMKTEFARYVAGNQEIHFSAGLSMTKPGLPIRQLAELAEDALDAAKTHNPEQTHPVPKNAATAFGESVAWADFDELMKLEKKLADLAGGQGLSTGYLYGLLRYIDMAEQEKAYQAAIARGETPNIAIENALWHSHFAYQTRRLVETRFRDIEDPKQREALRRDLQSELAQRIAEDGIKKHGAAYRIALFTYLYLQRD